MSDSSTSRGPDAAATDSTRSTGLTTSHSRWAPTVRRIRSGCRRRGQNRSLAGRDAELRQLRGADARPRGQAGRRCSGSSRSRTITGLRSADEDTATRAGTFRAALAHRGYRLALGAYACGAASIGASSIVVSVSLFERTGSPAWAGVGALIRVVPFMLFSGVAGVVIDRTDGRRMLVVAVTAQLACSVALAATASSAPLVLVTALGFAGTLLVDARVPLHGFARPTAGRHREPRSGQRAHVDGRVGRLERRPRPGRPPHDRHRSRGGGHRRGRHRRGRRHAGAGGPPAAAAPCSPSPGARAVLRVAPGRCARRSSVPQRSRFLLCWSS